MIPVPTRTEADILRFHEALAELLRHRLKSRESTPVASTPPQAPQPA